MVELDFMIIFLVTTRSNSLSRSKTFQELKYFQNSKNDCEALKNGDFYHFWY